jgi:hypothetical protein
MHLQTVIFSLSLITFATFSAERTESPTLSKSTFEQAAYCQGYQDLNRSRMLIENEDYLSQLQDIQQALEQTNPDKAHVEFRDHCVLIEAKIEALSAEIFEKEFLPEYTHAACNFIHDFVDPKTEIQADYDISEDFFNDVVLQGDVRENAIRFCSDSDNRYHKHFIELELNTRT